MKRSTTVKFFFALASGFFLMLLYYALCSGITTVEGMVTKKVIIQAVACLAKDMDHPDWGSESYTSKHGIIWMAGTCAGEAVYAREFGEDWNREVYASIRIAEAGRNQNTISYYEKPENGGGSVKTYYRFLNLKELAREYLKNPERLQVIYLAHKDFMLAEIAKYPGLGEKLRGLLSSEITTPVSRLGISQLEFESDMARLRHLKDSWAREYNARAEGANATWREWHALEKDMLEEGITHSRINTYEWFKRREGEGGEGLALQWRSVALDLEQALAE